MNSERFNPPRFYEARPSGPQRAELGESPRLDSRSGHIIWVDIPAGMVHRAALIANQVIPLVSHDVGSAVGGMVGTVVPLSGQGDGWIVAAQDAVCHLAADGEVRVLSRPEAGRGTRFNDGACDPWGRLWLGSMGQPVRPGAGRLLRLERDGTLTVILAEATISNGIGWSPDGSRVYYVDTATSRLDVLHLDAAGDVTERRTLVTFDPDQGKPDGLDVDDEGCVWVAMWDGWSVRRYSPTGELLAVVKTPVSRPTACCFSGETLIITTACEGISDESLCDEPAAGRLLLADVGVSGPSARPYLGPWK